MPDREQQIREKLEPLEKEVRRLRKERRELKRKRIGLPAKKRGSYTRNGHEYLDWEDLLAITQRRIDIFTNAGGEVAWWDKSDPSTVEEIRPASCQGCAETHLVGWNEGEWSHPKSKGERRCDCAEHSLWVCRAWHRVYGHGRELHWTQRQPEAESDLERDRR